MNKLSLVLILVYLTGCQFISPLEVLVLSSAGSSLRFYEVVTKSYTVGPVSSPELLALLSKATDTSEERIHVFGLVNFYWSYYHKLFRGVVALTNDTIIFLKWHVPSNEYKIIQSIPFDGIISMSYEGPGLRATIEFRHAEFNFAHKSYGVDQVSSLSFINSDIIVNERDSVRSIGVYTYTDSKKNEAAFELLKKKIKVKIISHDTYDTYDTYDIP